jgi:hypothetical protein
VAVQVAASRAIANVKNADLNLEVGIKEYAHPPFAVTTFEGIIAPLFLIGCECLHRAPDSRCPYTLDPHTHLSNCVLIIPFLLRCFRSYYFDERFFRWLRRRHVSLRDSDERDCHGA